MTEPRSIHIIGAGMAGLSAALQMSLMGEKVTVYESAQVAGGRCRSYFDRGIDCRIDNGNHLVLSGNVAVHEYDFGICPETGYHDAGERFTVISSRVEGSVVVARMRPLSAA